MKLIDLRSDTVTRPTPGMREAMAHADVGDDIYGEDPSVNTLQQDLCELFGKEAALFVPTGSMGNQLAVKAHTQPADEVIAEGEAHIFHYETAGPAVWSAVQVYRVPGKRGVPEVQDMKAAIRPDAYYYPRTSLVCLENTHNRAGGTIFPLERIHEIKALCEQYNLKLHLDGARIWNAHIASGVSLKEYGQAVDSINVCFSKGLGAPVGSMLMGDKEFIAIAHRYRKVFGGAMRQVGILASAASYALEHHLPFLADDHRRAKEFAGALKDNPYFAIDLPGVETNMVILDFEDSKYAPEEAQSMLMANGIIIGAGRAKTLRAVFHLDLNDEDLEQAIAIFNKTFS